MTRDELLARLAGLRQARVGQVRVPHKPLLTPRPHQPTVDIVYVSWHHRQVFKGALGI